jgi:EAL and modified HD-GYP domain-containing signal transduction protein
MALMIDSKQNLNKENIHSTYVARQPIVDRNINVIGYELLYRNGLENAFPDIDPDLATRYILTEQFLLRQKKVLNNKLGFINFHSISLLKKIPLDFSEAKFIVEILESCEPNQELYDLITELKSAGYQIALDDFIPSDKWEIFLDIVDIIKFDIRAFSISKAELFIATHRKLPIKYIAEKVETYEEFHQAKAAGFDFFQGYFFKKPEIITYKKVTSSLTTCMQLCKAVANSPIDLAKVESIIAKDTVLSFKLLNFVNSCARISIPIQSFHQALTYLGEDRIRKFASYTALMGINPKKPKQLFYVSLHRAKFFEILMQKNLSKNITNEAYLCGMLSLIDGLLDGKLESILTPLSLSEPLKNAIINRTGELSPLLELADALDNGDWEKVTQAESQLGIEHCVTIDAENQAQLWLHEMF